jgi:cytochrome P450
MAKKDFTFSDGTFIPKGTMLALPAYAMHHDEEVFEDAHEFHGFRFAEMRDPTNPTSNARLQLVATGPKFIGFGYGKHAWYVVIFSSSLMLTEAILIVLGDSLP